MGGVEQGETVSVQLHRHVTDDDLKETPAWEQTQTCKTCCCTGIKAVSKHCGLGTTELPAARALSGFVERRPASVNGGGVSMYKCNRASLERAQ